MNPLETPRAGGHRPNTARNGTTLLSLPTDALAVAALARALQDAHGRVAAIVTELEIGETGIAYQIAADLELDLEAALADRPPLSLHDLVRAA
jgi:hypothetical protein